VYIKNNGLRTFMSSLSYALKIICRYEGFSEKAYPDPATGGPPYTLGYGTQFYPDGSPVRQGHRCTKAKAMEYLLAEARVIDNELTKLNLGLDEHMRYALISFIHSIGWEPFLYSPIVDLIEQEDFCGATAEMSHWIFDADRKVIGGLLERRREEVSLFLEEVDANPWASTEILLTAFRNYSAAPHQVRAIRILEERISPYILSTFANEFDIDNDGFREWEEMVFDFSFTS